MSVEIVLEARHAAIVRSILSQFVPVNEVWVFGSRAGGSPKPHSDLDLVIIDSPTFSENQLSELKFQFEESNLPFRVDVCLWSSLDAGFRESIQRSHVVFELRYQC